MKNILFILSLVAMLSCKAQSPIISTVDYANDDDDNIQLVEGSYLKDVENKFAPFIGTWKWEDGTSSLEIEFSKLEMVYSNKSNYYKDFLIGKYRYIENGIEKHNSFVLDINVDNFWGYSYALIYGGGYSEDNYKGFTIVDLAKNLYCNLAISLTTTTEATWRVWRKDGGKQLDGFTFPTEVTLIKQ